MYVQQQRHQHACTDSITLCKLHILQIPFKNLEPHVVGIFFVIKLSLTAYINPSTAPNDFPAMYTASLCFPNLHYISAYILLKTLPPVCMEYTAQGEC